MFIITFFTAIIRREVFMCFILQSVHKQSRE